MKVKIQEIIEASVFDARMQSRAANEKVARDLITQNLGSLSASQLAIIFEKIDTDYWEGKEKQGRFGVTFLGNNRKLICEQVDSANRWIEDFWNAPLDKCIALVDRFMQEKPIKGAKFGFPSLILYLRDPQRFNIWIEAMWGGMKVVTGESFAGNSGGHYEKLNAAIIKFRDEYKLLPQAMDTVLNQIYLLGKTNGVNMTSTGSGAPAPADSLFTVETFDLLKKLHDYPVAATYQNNKESLKKSVELPLQNLLLGATEQLPVEIRDCLETQKGIFSRILKNDYGKGGAWDFYWGALYPKGGKRKSDAQLYIWMNHEILRFGFSVGDYGKEQAVRFLKNAPVCEPIIIPLLTPATTGENLLFDIKIGDTISETTDPTEWFQSIDPGCIRARVEFKSTEVIALAKVQFIQRVANIFQKLFPLMLMASDDDPFSKISLLTGEDTDSVIQPAYTISECANDCGLKMDTLERWVRAIERKGQAVIYGPPGTGKTFTAKLIAKHLINETDGFQDLIQFHPAYAYEDFMQGIRPQTNKEGVLTYPLVKGRFMEFCRDASQRKGTCVLILDEINRANLSRVFGELMYLLEYREESIPLAAGEKFSIPKNVRIIGTMNTADRSIALVDHALRRRFAFLELYPNYEVLAKYHEESDFEVSGLVAVLKDVNKKINDPNYSVGISFFMRVELESHIEDIWLMEIQPYLEEYFFAQPSNAEELRWEKVKTKILSP